MVRFSFVKFLCVYRQAVSVKNDYEIERTMNQFEAILKKYPTCSETYGLYAQVSVTLI